MHHKFLEGKIFFIFLDEETEDLAKRNNLSQQGSPFCISTISTSRQNSAVVWQKEKSFVVTQVTQCLLTASCSYWPRFKKTLVRCGKSLSNRNHKLHDFSFFLVSSFEKMLLYLVYYIPTYITTIYALRVPGCGWMTDLACLMAGGSFQVKRLWNINDVVTLWWPHLKRWRSQHELPRLSLEINTCWKSESTFITSALARGSQKRTSWQVRAAC